MTKKCSTCKQILPIECFGLNKSGTNGLDWSCKKCAKENRKNYRRSLPRKNLKSNDYMKISHFYTEDVEYVYKLLELLGYDISKDIHQQFIDRNNSKFGLKMTYKEKKKDRMTKYFEKYNSMKNPPLDKEGLHG